MSAKFIIEDGDLQGLSFSLDQGENWTIGTDPEDCQWIIEDQLIAPKHALIQQSSTGITIQNLSESSPLYINEEEIDSSPHTLEQGDTIKIGNQLLRFYEDSTAHIIDEELSQNEESTLITETTEPFTEPLKEEPQKMNYDDTNETSDTIYSENDQDTPELAEINFNLVESGRWLLKVVGGPNNGAEFYMQTGQTYTIGTDPQSCDIVFHDNSVSRQHARISINSEDLIEIEDLNSRNGVLIEGKPIEGRVSLATSSMVTLGTTSFLVYDREGEMQTIISPLLPSIFKALQQKEEADAKEIENALEMTEELSEGQKTPPEGLPPHKPQNHGSLILIAIVIGLFSLAAIGTTALFREKPVTLAIQKNANELIQKVLAPYPAVKFIYNQGSGGLLLLGHVSTPTDKSQILYNLSNLKFIKSTDDSGLVIDEGVWREMNSILSKNPAWKGISVQSPAAGQFILRGDLKTLKEAEQLSNYLSLNFSYLDLLKKDIVVEEDVLNQVNGSLRDAGLSTIIAKINNGELSLTGNVPSDKINDLAAVIAKAKTISGVRGVNNYVQTQATEMGMQNLSDQYEVTGKSKTGNKYFVMINGKILSEGDALDGLEIKKITSNTILLEKGDTKYRIDY